MSSGMKGTAFYPSGSSPRTRDWSRPPESEKTRPKTATEIAADAFLAQHERWKREEREDEQRKADAERAERLRRQQEADRKRAAEDRKRRETEFENAELLIAGACDQYGLTPDERTQIEDTITKRGLWSQPMAAVEFATMRAAEIAARKPKPKEVPWGMCEIGEDD
jgi:uncharacterized protein with von Willebrand factor type A (vWA) domain